APVVISASLLLGKWIPPPLPGSGQDMDLALQGLPPQRPFTVEHAEALRAALEQLQPALATARKLADLPRGRHAVAWSPDYIGTLMPHINDVRTVARLLVLDAAMRADSGDIDGALESARAALNAGRSD